MGTAHKSYRLDEALLADVDAYAEARGLKASEAVSALLRAGLDAMGRDGAEDADEDAPRADATAQTDGTTAEAIRALTAQLAAKDEQIRAALAVASQAQAISYRALEAPEATDGAEAAQDGTRGEQGPEDAQGGPEGTQGATGRQTDAREGTDGEPTPWRARLARWIAGR